MGLMVRASDLKALYEAAARSLMQIMVGGSSADRPKTVKLTVHGEDRVDLMVRWLGEILYLLEGEEEVVVDVEIQFLSPRRLDAVLRTVPLDPSAHERFCEIKAVTYHNSEVVERGAGWEAKVIFDL
jgi:SHS2 domain-containing protein